MTEPTIDDQPVIENPAAVLAALDRAKSDAKKYREKFEALQTEVDEQGWQKRAKVAELKLALSEEKVANPDRVVKLIDLDELTYDDDGNLTGVADRVESLKGDFPELFDVKRRTKHSERQPGQPADVRPQTPSEIQADILLGT